MSDCSSSRSFEIIFSMSSITLSKWLPSPSGRWHVRSSPSPVVPRWARAHAQNQELPSTHNSRLYPEISCFCRLSLRSTHQRIEIESTERWKFLCCSGRRTGVHLGREHREAHVLRLRRGVLQDVVRLRLAAVRLHLSGHPRKFPSILSQPAREEARFYNKSTLAHAQKTRQRKKISPKTPG